MKFADKMLVIDEIIENFIFNLTFTWSMFYNRTIGRYLRWVNWSLVAFILVGIRIYIDNGWRAGIHFIGVSIVIYVMFELYEQWMRKTTYEICLGMEKSRQEMCRGEA